MKTPNGYYLTGALDRIDALELKISRVEARNLDIHLDHIKASEANYSAILDRLGAIDDRLRVVEENHQKKEPHTLQPVRPVYAAGKSATASSQSAGDLPAGMVPYYTFMHGVPANTAKRLLEVAGVNIIRGIWIVGGHRIDKALDAEGQASAYEALRTHPRFTPCADPHE